MFAVEPLVGDWIYPAALAAVVGVPGAAMAAGHLGRRLAARWNEWTLTPQPRNTARRRRPPTPRGA